MWHCRLISPSPGKEEGSSGQWGVGGGDGGDGGGVGRGWLLSRNNSNSKFIYALATHLYSIYHQFTMLVCLFSDLVKSKIEANGFLNKLARRESDLAEAQRTTYTEECCFEGCKVEEIAEYCGHLL